VSNRALRWAFNLPVTGARKPVLLALADHANIAGMCWPSIGRLAVFAGVTDRAVRATLRDLEADGVVRTVHTQGRPSRYELIINSKTPEQHSAPTPERRSSPKPKQPRNVVPPSPEGGSAPPRNVVPGPRNVVPPNPYEPLRQPPMNPQGSTQLFAEHTKRRSRISPDWLPSLESVAHAKTKGLDAESEANKFRRHYLASGMLQLDWNLKFQGWCDNARPPQAINGRSREPAGKLDWLHTTETPHEDIPTIDGEIIG
jgi:hypothetical protein